MRLTIDLISQAPQYISPSRNWTISLRGHQLDTIENLGATADHFECIDLSDNEIIKLQNIPPLYRLNTLILCNNRISRIAPDLFEFIPNLQSLVLTNNRIEKLTDLEPLRGAKRLERLVLLDNPVCGSQYYRSYLLHLTPSLRFIDFARVRKEERDASIATFNSENGKKLIQQIAPPRVSPSLEAANAESPSKETADLSQKQLDAIKKAISQATTIEEINRLETALKNGVMPEGITVPANELEADGNAEK